MSQKFRLILLSVALIVLLVIGWKITGNLSFVVNDFWFTSGLLLLILLSLVDQPYFSKDSNIFVNAITAGIALLLIPNQNRNWIFWTFLIATAYLILSSFVLMWIRNKPLVNENKLTQFVSKINREIGKPQALFSVFFLWGAVAEFGTQISKFGILLLFWAIFMALNNTTVEKAIIALFEKLDKCSEENILGTIFGVQSKNTFLVKLLPLEERKQKILTFDYVEFLYSGDETNELTRGIVLEKYLLDEQQWIKVLHIDEVDKAFENSTINQEKYKKDILYKTLETPTDDITQKLVGVIAENSSIETIRFIYNSKIKIVDGNLLEINIGSSKVYYQIVEGFTKIEQLQNRNEAGYIVGEAQQLGTWDVENAKFDPFGWVPEINSPVFKASMIEQPSISIDEFELGKIPETNFPVIINKDVALTHHTAVIGVTGTGKSVFSRNLIREYLKDDNIKVIAIDFTGEYKGKFDDLKPVQVVTDEENEEIYKVFEWLIKEYAEYKNRQRTEEIDKKEKFIKDTFARGLKNFFERKDSQICIVELPEISNSVSGLEYTQQLLKNLFSWAKYDRCFNHKVCVVLEEAHTIVPEWNFAGSSDKGAQAMVNSISQIALQGRKYDIGLLVIAQRTANVSKTILTQCNTIVSFQEFDDTSKVFLANYFGDGIAKVLPTLRLRQAIIAGKAVKSNIPMIFQVPEIIEPQNEENNGQTEVEITKQELFEGME